MNYFIFSTIKLYFDVDIDVTNEKRFSFWMFWNITINIIKLFDVDAILIIT